MIKTDTPMDLNYFNDFYLVESIKAEINSAIAINPRLEFSHSVMKLRDDIQEFCDTVYPNMAMRTFVYLYAACAGEARHARNQAAQSYFFPESLNCERGQIFQLMTEFAPTPENIDAIIDIFDQKWVGSFGGKMWHQIAKALKMYFEVTPATFIDHVVDLQHNNGTVFSKTESKYLQFIINYDGSFNHFLDMKFRYNILKRNIGQSLRITRGVMKLIERWKVVFRETTEAYFNSTLKTLTDYQIVWGERRFTKVQKWANWADCSEGNIPNLSWLISKLTRGHNYHKLTRPDFKKVLKTIKKRGLQKMAVFGKKYNNEWARKLLNYYARMKSYLPYPKQKVLYQNIPIKFKVTINKKSWSGEMEMQFPVPFYGHGEKTDYGFKIIGPSQGAGRLPGDTTGFDGEEGFIDGVMTYDSYIVINSKYEKIYWKDKKLEAILA